MRQLVSRDVDEILVIDDNPEARAGFKEMVEDAHFRPNDQTGRLPPLTQYVETIGHRNSHAAICDQLLRKRQYAHFDGAELVKQLYLRHVPAVLCTDYAELVDQIRPFRRWVPQLVKPDDLDPDRLVEALTECIWELDVDFRPPRRPWRAQVLVDDATDAVVYLEVPAWDSKVIPYELSWPRGHPRADEIVGCVGRLPTPVRLGAVSP